MFASKVIRMKNAKGILAIGSSRWRQVTLVGVLSVLAFRVAADTNSADAKRYLDDVKALASPQMEGRGAGTKGITLAADMIEQRYRALGLQPAGTKSYFQPFTVITGAKLNAANHLEFEDGNAKPRAICERRLLFQTSRPTQSFPTPVAPRRSFA